MKQKREAIRQKSIVKDHGKDLFDTVVFLILGMLVLWYLNV